MLNLTESLTPWIWLVLGCLGFGWAVTTTLFFFALNLQLHFHFIFFLPDYAKLKKIVSHIFEEGGGGGGVQKSLSRKLPIYSFIVSVTST